MDVLNFASGMDINPHHIYLMLQSVVLPKCNYAGFCDFDKNSERAQLAYDEIDAIIINFVKQLFNLWDVQDSEIKEMLIRPESM